MGSIERYLAFALVFAMHGVQEIDALDTKPTEETNDELSQERELADIESEGDHEWRRGHQSRQVKPIAWVP